jgi:hypothetical protein
MSQLVLDFSAMSYPRGVRNIGMGTSGTADNHHFSTGFFNPASLAWAGPLSIGSSYQDWILDMRLTDTRISGAGRLRRGQSENMWRFGGSVGYSTLSTEPKEERVVFLPEGTGSTFNPDDYYVSTTGAVAWERGRVCVGVGGSAKYLSEEHSLYDWSTWAFDIGALAAFSLSWNAYQLQPRVGAVVGGRL